MAGMNFVCQCGSEHFVEARRVSFDTQMKRPVMEPIDIAIPVYKCARCDVRYFYDFSQEKFVRMV